MAKGQKKAAALALKRYLVGRDRDRQREKTGEREIVCVCMWCVECVRESYNFFRGKIMQEEINATLAEE